MSRQVAAVAVLGASTALGLALLPGAAAAPVSDSGALPPVMRTTSIVPSVVPTSITGYDPPRALGVGQVLRDRVVVSGPAGRPVSLQVKRGTRWRTVATVRTVANRALGLPVASFAVPMSKLTAAAGLRVRGLIRSTIFRTTTRVTAPRSGAASGATTGGRTTTVTKGKKTLLGVVPEFVVGDIDVEHWWKGPKGVAPYTDITGSVRFVSNGGTALTNGGARAVYSLWTASLSWRSRGYTIDDCVHTGTGRVTAANLISEQPYVVPVVAGGSLARSTPYSFGWFRNATYSDKSYYSCRDGILPSTIINALTFRTQVCSPAGGLRAPVVARPAPGGAWAMSGALPRTGTPCSTPNAPESYDVSWRFTGVGWKEIYLP